MSPGSRLAALILLIAFWQSGCIFSTSSSTAVVAREYEPPDSPVNVLHNLSLSLEKQDISRYMETLAPEFQFVFSPHPESPCSGGSWDAAQDSTATAGLFLDSNVTRVQAFIRHGNAAPATEIEMEGTWRVHASNVAFYLRRSDDATYTTDGDTHEFFFRPGLEDEGEDPDAWFLAEWRDLSGRGVASTAGARPAAVAPVHWWEIKCGYLSGVR